MEGDAADTRDPLRRPDALRTVRLAGGAVHRTPYPAAYRTTLIFLARSIEFSGRGVREGWGPIELLPAKVALDIVYTVLAIDDIGGMASPRDRQDRREAIDLILNEPLDPIKAIEYQREHWGTDREAREAQEATDAVFGDSTYGMEG